MRIESFEAGSVKRLQRKLERFFGDGDKEIIDINYSVRSTFPLGLFVCRHFDIITYRAETFPESPWTFTRNL